MEEESFQFVELKLNAIIHPSVELSAQVVGLDENVARLSYMYIHVTFKINGTRTMFPGARAQGLSLTVRALYH